MTASRWLSSRLREAPPGLRLGVERYLEVDEPGGTPAPEQIATAAMTALKDAVGGPSDRSGAGVVLIADALVTLALRAQADRDPAALARFAESLRKTAALGA